MILMADAMQPTLLVEHRQVVIGQRSRGSAVKAALRAPPARPALPLHYRRPWTPANFTRFPRYHEAYSGATYSSE
jgi:hypothetical protein